MAEHFVAYLFEYALRDDNHNIVIQKRAYNAECVDNYHLDNCEQKPRKIIAARQYHRLNVIVDKRF